MLGKGVSTDIIEASCLAYLNAANRIIEARQELSLIHIWKPTARMLLNTEASGRNPRQTTLSSWFFSWLSTKPSSMPPI